MKSLPVILTFDWDEKNRSKIVSKHAVEPKEAESVFADEGSTVFPDVKHSQTEERLVILGKSQIGRTMFAVFTIREDKIRIISARFMHRKEVEKHEQFKKNIQVKKSPEI